MRRVKNQLPEKKKLNNSGSAMILALTVLSLIAILGIMALSSALLNVRMRDLNRKSDKNFYYLETALDEIYAQTGRMASDILKENYLGVMEKLYKDGYRTNDEANAWLTAGFMKELTGENALGLSLPLTDENNEENLKNAAETGLFFGYDTETESGGFYRFNYHGETGYAGRGRACDDRLRQCGASVRPRSAGQLQRYHPERILSDLYKSGYRN